MSWCTNDDIAMFYQTSGRSLTTLWLELSGQVKTSQTLVLSKFSGRATHILPKHCAQRGEGIVRRSDHKSTVWKRDDTTEAGVARSRPLKWLKRLYQVQIRSYSDHEHVAYMCEIKCRNNLDGATVKWIWISVWWIVDQLRGRILTNDKHIWGIILLYQRNVN